MAITFNHNDKFYVNGSNVGIGTSTPDTLLHIESTSSASSPIFTIENDNDVKLKLGSVRSAAGTAPDTTFIAYDGDLRFIADADSTTEVVRIDSSGNVGIGKTDPSAPLHINGGSTNQVVKIQATTAPYVRFKEGGTDVGFIQFGTDTYISNQKAGTLNFRTNNTDKMTILSGGNVGIGITSPLTKLHVEGGVTINTGNGASTFNDLNIGGVAGWSNSEAHRINFVYGNGTSDIFQTIESYYGGANEGKMRFRNFYTNNPQTGILMTIHSNGNVGIGTDSPEAQLHVSSASSSVTSVHIGNTGTGVSRAYFDASNGDFSGGDYMWIGQNNDLSGEIVMTQSAGAFHIKTQPGGTITSRLTVLQNGNVGIGSTSPIGTLEVQAASSIDGTQLTIANDYGESSKVLAFNNDTDQVGYLSVYGRPSTGGDGPYMSLGLSNGTSVVERLHIAKNGSLDFNAYGAGGFKGDATYVLGVDSSGNVVETTTAGVYFGTNTSNGTYTNQWQRVLVIDTGNFDSQGFRLRIEGTGNTSGQSIVAEIEFNFKNQNGAIRARTTVNSYGTHPVDKDDIAVYFDTTNLEATFYFKVTQNYTTPIYSIVSGRIRNYAFYSNVIGDDTALASETNDSITSNLKFQGITQDNDSGLVGIGTTNPSAKLHIDGGSVKVTGTATDQYFLEGVRTGVGTTIRIYDNANTAYIDSYNNMAFRANQNGGSGGSFRFTGGNVGIGETDPKAKLNITGVSGGPTVPVASSSDGIVRIESSNGGVGLDIGAQGASPYSMWMQVGNTSNSSGDTYPILLNPLGGNVGIGTTDPNAKLDVVGNTRLGSGTLHVSTDQTFVTGFTYSFRDAVGIINPNGTSAAAATAVMSIGGMSNGHSLVTTGNVGIGTTSPGAKLDVSDTTTGKAAIIGNTTHNSRLQIYTAAVGKNSEIWFGDAADDDIGKIDYDHADNSLSFFTNTAEAMRITSTGNVGIGTTAPAGKLHLEGNFESGKALVIKGTYGTDTTHYIRTHGVNSEELAFYSGTAKPLAIDTSGRIKVNNAFYMPTADGSSGQVMTTNGSGTLSWSNVTSSDTLDDVTDNGGTTTNSITVGGVTSTSGGEMQGGDLYFKNGGDDGAGTHLANVWYSVSTGGGAAPVGVYESAVITTVNNGTHGRSDIVFKTKDNNTANFGSANERMRITKDGKVGIGTNNPTYKFEVSNGTQTGTFNPNSSGFMFLGSTSNHPLYFGVNDSTKAAILSNGQVGIGTTNPASLLHLGKVQNGENRISFGEAGYGGPHGLDFYGDDATRTLKYSIYYRTGTENISMETSDGTKRFEINQSGAVTLNEAFTFPTADGGAGSALITNGSGALSWNAGYKQYSPVGWTVLNNQTYTSTGANISSSSTQAQAGTTPVQRNSATEFEATKQGWYEISYSFLVKNNYTNRAMIGAYMTVSTSGGGGVVSGSHSTQYVRYNTYGEYAQIQNTFYYYTAYASTNFYLLAYLLSGSMNMTTQSINQSMISFRYINNDIT